MAEHSIPSQHIDQLHVSVLTSAHYEKKFLWPMLKGAQVYGHKEKYLKVTLTWSFNKITIVDSILGAFDQNYSTRYKIPFCGSGIKSYQNVVSYPIKVVPLLHHWTFLTWKVDIVACKVQCWVRPLMYFSLSSLHSSF